MLFYEWRSGKGGNEQRNQSESPTTMSPGSSVLQLQETGKYDEAQASTSEQMAIEDAIIVETAKAIAECDIESKAVVSTNQVRKSEDEDPPKISSALTKAKRKSLLNKDLEDWIWQDNRHYLEDRNIFEHTYFK